MGHGVSRYHNIPQLIWNLKTNLSNIAFPDSFLCLLFYLFFILLLILNNTEWNTFKSCWLAFKS